MTAQPEYKVRSGAQPATPPIYQVERADNELLDFVALYQSDWQVFCSQIGGLLELVAEYREYIYVLSIVYLFLIQ